MTQVSEDNDAIIFPPKKKLPAQSLLGLIGGMTVVGLLAYVVNTGQVGFLSSVQAAFKTLALKRGDRGLVACEGQLNTSWVNNRHSQLNVNCVGTRTASITPTPTNVPTAVTPTPTPTPQQPTGSAGSSGAAPAAVSPGSPGDLAHAMGIWNPSRSDTCTKAQHDAYSVIGPDGKRYPTWHPPTGPGGCTFGHEHGRNPAGYELFDEVRRHFAYDANHDGTISDSELATAGLPFGYANEQVDAYFAAGGAGTFMRHEDHYGHKVEYANGEADTPAADRIDSKTSGGVVVPIRGSGGNKWAESGVRCYHLHKVHQGVSTPDAFGNNLHELILHSKCISSRSGFSGGTVLLTGMVAFGAPGEFTRFCPDNRTQVISVGVTDANRNFPSDRGEGMRNIVTRDCVEKTMLVPPGQFSGFPYEIWAGKLQVRPPGREWVASTIGSWEVLDAIRYYNPGADRSIGYMADTCYETLGDRQARGGTCDSMTNYRKVQGITWDDPRSDFRGIHRGQYVSPPRIHNVGGPPYWYTDPFGGNAKQAPFPGSVKQLVSPVDADPVPFAADPRIIQRYHDSGGETVHAPN